MEIVCSFSDRRIHIPNITKGDLALSGQWESLPLAVLTIPEDGTFHWQGYNQFIDCTLEINGVAMELGYKEDSESVVTGDKVLVENMRVKFKRRRMR